MWSGGWVGQPPRHVRREVLMKIIPFFFCLQIRVFGVAIDLKIRG
jgi:hypothetical protein